MAMTATDRYLFPIDRRSGRDRRKHKLPKLKFLFANGARGKIRRHNDRHKFFFFDKYSANLLAAIMIILLFSVLDALFTLFLTGNGSDELNPVMAYFLNLNPWAFISVKYFLTCVSVIILLIFHNYYYPKINFYARKFLLYLAGAFTMVVLWELYLVYLYHAA